MKSRMTDPRTYLIRMAIIPAITAVIIGLLWPQLARAFAGNIALNSVIVATALIGVAFIFRQTLRLVPEAKWLGQIQKTSGHAALPHLAGLIRLLAVTGREQKTSSRE